MTTDIEATCIIILIIWMMVTEYRVSEMWSKYKAERKKNEEAE